MITQINWNPTSRDLKKFGLTILIGLGLIGGFLYWKDFNQAAQIVWIVAAVIGVTAIVVPPLSRPFYSVWMGVAFVMGTIISTLILILIFYGLFVPIGLIMKMIGRDPLKLKKSSFKGGTYWQTHSDINDKKYYERLF